VIDLHERRHERRVGFQFHGKWSEVGGSKEVLVVEGDKGNAYEPCGARHIRLEIRDEEVWLQLFKIADILPDGAAEIPEFWNYVLCRRPVAESVILILKLGAVDFDDCYGCVLVEGRQESIAECVGKDGDAMMCS
jgi:hypothetical protein